jgi:uncharacterized phage infection (PIP) family protein YhgE
MADDLDAMLDGQETPAPASQAQNGSQIDKPDEGEQSEEEVEFNKLSGNTQDRIRQLSRRVREVSEKNQQYESMLKTVPPPAPSNEPNADVQQAVRKLSEVGIATKEDVQNTVAAGFQQLRYEAEMQRLSEKYSGEDNKPKFDRSEYEEYLRDNPTYQNYFPEDTFKKVMFEDEFYGTGGSPSVRTSQTLKPTKTSSGQRQTMSAEDVEQKLQSLPPGDRQKWYEEHFDEVQKAVAVPTA